MITSKRKIYMTCWNYKGTKHQSYIVVLSYIMIVILIEISYALYNSGIYNAIQITNIIYCGYPITIIYVFIIKIIFPLYALPVSRSTYYQLKVEVHYQCTVK